MTWLAKLFNRQSKQKKAKKIKEPKYGSYRGYLIETLHGHCNGVYKGVITQVGKVWCYEQDLPALKKAIDAAIKILPDKVENTWLVFSKAV